jgi:hypothetical protein
MCLWLTIMPVSKSKYYYNRSNMYKYYILPLRVFLLKFQQRTSVDEKFENYYFLFFLIHIAPPAIFLLTEANKRYHIKYILIYIFSLIFYYATSALYGKLTRHFLNKHELTIEQAENERLYRIGQFIYFEPWAFLPVYLIIYGLFHFFIRLRHSLL